MMYYNILYYGIIDYVTILDNTLYTLYSILYMYTYLFIFVCVYIYIYIERERETYSIIHILFIHDYTYIYIYIYYIIPYCATLSARMPRCVVVLDGGWRSTRI